MDEGQEAEMYKEILVPLQWLTSTTATPVYTR